MSCSSSSDLLRASDDESCLELMYLELCRLLFGNQSLSRKEKSNKLNLECQWSGVVWCK